MTPCFRTTLFCLVLILLCLVVFAEVRTHQFVFDDLGFISRNSMVKDGLSWNGLVWAFTTKHMGIWHPLTWLSHMLDCQFFGENAAGPHLINLFFHTANSLLLFLLLQFCTGAGWPSFLAAALFAVHPLHVESVAWVAERKDVLSAFFWLLTMWAYTWYVRSPGWQPYFLTMLCLCLGMLAKPMLVTLPLALLLWDFWPLQRWASKKMAAGKEAGIFREGKADGPRASWPRLVWEKTPLMVPAVIFSLVAIYSQEMVEAVVSLADIPLSARVSNALVAYATYLGKTLWPLGLAAYYPHPGNTIPLWESLGAGLILAVISWLIVRRALRYPYLLVGWLWFLGTLVPVIGLVQVGSQGLADRYTYTPLIGLFIMAAWGLQHLLDRWQGPKFLMPLVSGVIILLYGTCAWFQVSVWRDSVALFEHTLSVTRDNALAHGALGEVLYFQGKVDQSLVHFQQAIRLDPGNGLNGLAWVMATTGNPRFLDGAKAVELATMANKLTQYKQPGFLDTLAAAYAAAGNFPEAVNTANQALALARGAGKTDLAREIEKRLKLYRQGRIYRDEAYDALQN